VLLDGYIKISKNRQNIKLIIFEYFLYFVINIYFSFLLRFNAQSYFVYKISKYLFSFV
jgi:hypothetical protein